MAVTMFVPSASDAVANVAEPELPRFMVLNSVAGPQGLQGDEGIVGRVMLTNCVREHSSDEFAAIPGVRGPADGGPALHDLLSAYANGWAARPILFLATPSAHRLPFLKS